MIDFNKPVQTSDKRKARVLTSDATGSQPIVALVTDVDGSEFAAQFCTNGRFRRSGEAHPLDLINVPERVDKWFNLYSEEAGMAFYSRAESIEASSSWPPHMLALVKVTFEDGKPVAVALEGCK